MNGTPSDQQLLQVVSGPTPKAIADVIAMIQNIDQLLRGNDGLKWFNRLYLMVTQQVGAQSSGSVWNNAQWLDRLDVVFAGLYFVALTGFLTHSTNTPSSWNALFEGRFNAGVDRIQFALAGMNAHINHDLALALLQTDDELQLTPGLNSPEHDDYERVNSLLKSVLPAALQVLATGITGELAQDTGKIGRFLAIWDIKVARDLAWDFADHLRNLNGMPRMVALTEQDQLTGGIGRSLLLPV
jgi:hypothetical protein